MRHLEQLRGLGGIELGVDGTRGGRPLDGDPGSTEDQQVEVELARPPATAILPAELAFEALERREEVEGAGRRILDRPARREPRQRSGTRAGRRRRPARWRTGATRHGRGWRAAPRARELPRRGWPRHRRRWRRGRCTRGRGGRTRVPLRWRLDSEPCARSASESCTRDRARTRDRWSAGWPRSAVLVARRHATGFAAAGASDVEIVSAPTDAPMRRPLARVFATSCRAAAARASSCSAPGPSRWRRPPTGARSWPPPGRTTGGRWPTIGIRPTWSRSHGPRHSPRSRTCPVTTPCRAGSRRSRATASTTSAGAGGSGSTSTARSTSCSSDRGTRRPSMSGA